MYKEYRKVTWLCFFCSFVVIKGIPESRILDSLLKNYDKFVKPEGRVSVKHSLSLTNIISYENNILTANVWSEYMWTDRRLTWNRTEEGVDKLTIPSRLLWKPDIILYNNAGADSGMIYDDINIAVDQNGSVLYAPPMRLTSQCSEEGFLLITCHWKFGSWAYTSNDLDLHTDRGLNMANYAPNQNFYTIKTKVNRTVTYYSCCPEPYVVITYTLDLRKS